MKRFLPIFLSFFMILILGACSNSSGNASVTTAAENTAAEQTEQAEENSNSDISTELSVAEATETALGQAELPEEIQTENTEADTKILVAYFSATGTTKALAEYAADSLGADIYEIVPEEPYTAADLDYGDSNSRSTKEMDDPDCRPAISGNVENFEQYSIVFIGYPIWWGEAPRIIDTFVESYDFSGKTVVPFCTSGGSGIGSSAKNLHVLASGTAVWLDGDRLSSNFSREDTAEWINSLGLEVTAK